MTRTRDSVILPFINIIMMLHTYPGVYQHNYDASHTYPGVYQHTYDASHTYPGVYQHNYDASHIPWCLLCYKITSTESTLIFKTLLGLFVLFVVHQVALYFFYQGVPPSTI